MNELLPSALRAHSAASSLIIAFVIGVFFTPVHALFALLGGSYTLLSIHGYERMSSVLVQEGPQRRRGALLVVLPLLKMGLSFGVIGAVCLCVKPGYAMSFLAGILSFLLASCTLILRG